MSILDIAHKRKIRSICFPSLSIGIEATIIAITTISDFLQANLDWNVSVSFCLSTDVESSVYAKLMSPESFLPISTIRKKKIRGRPYPADEPIVILVIDQNGLENNWYKAFKSREFRGREIKIEQTAWQSIVSCMTSSSKGLVMDLEPTPNSPFGTSMGQSRSVSPHIVLVRNFAKGAKNDEYKNFLFAIQLAGVPCVNSVQSLIDFTERARALHVGNLVEQELPEDFQMVPIDYYSNLGELYFEPKYPLVAKVGSAHAGYGKMMFKANNSNLDDFHGLVAMQREYITFEPFLDRSYEYRLQKMGTVIRCYSRESTTHDWKANQGEGIIKDLPVTARHLRIAECISKQYPHFDIWGADLLVTKGHQEYCLEINDSSIGFNEDHFEEDQQGIVDCVIARLEEFYKDHE